MQERVKEFKIVSECPHDCKLSLTVVADDKCHIWWLPDIHTTIVTFLRALTLLLLHVSNVLHYYYCYVTKSLYCNWYNVILTTKMRI